MEATEDTTMAVQDRVASRLETIAEGDPLQTAQYKAYLESRMAEVQRRRNSSKSTVKSALSRLVRVGAKVPQAREILDLVMQQRPQARTPWFVRGVVQKVLQTQGQQAQAAVDALRGVTQMPVNKRTVDVIRNAPRDIAGLTRKQVMRMGAAQLS